MTGDAGRGGGLQNYAVFAAAFVALFAFAWFVKYMLGLTTTAEELEWTRAVYLLNGVEAIAFAAAGFLFGREVHRREADRADQRASGAQTEAAAARVDAVEAETKGTALAAAVLVKSQGQTTKAGAYEALGAQDAAKLTQADLDELAALARRLFPENL